MSQRVSERDTTETLDQGTGPDELDEADAQPDQQTSVADAEDIDLSAYRTDHGTVPHELDVADADHPLKQVLGDTEHIEFKFESHVTSERFAFRYDDPTAAIREYVSNAETACVRRGRAELRACNTVPDDVDVDDLTPRQVIELAELYTEYVPRIEIDHAAHESDFPAFQIRDNGIGISVEEFLVLRNIGLSASHDQGQDLGSFGQGVLSAYPAVGKYGDVKCVTKSYTDGATYAFRMRLDGMNYADATRAGYGTTFTFPAFGYDVRDDIDVQSAVEKYTQGVVVPVLYREFDASNTEIDNEEYTPTNLTERYDSDPVVWEDDNGFVTAVMWPAESSHTAQTYNISMPIERNDGGFSTNTYDAPYHFDLRINYEDGRILHDPAGEHTGLIPIEPRGYEQLDPEDKQRYVPKDELTGEELRLPEPVDDRDRFKSGYDDTYRYISKRLEEAFHDAVRDDFEALAGEGLDYLLRMDESAGELFTVAWQKYRPPSSRAREKRVRNVFDKLDVDIDDEMVTEIATALKNVQYCQRLNSSCTRKRSRESMSALEYIATHAPDDDTGGTTYMSARTIHTYDKAKLAWHLHEKNEVVVVGSARRYDDFAEAFGWQKLKELTLYDIPEAHPELDEDIAEDLERGDYFEDDDDNDEPTEYTERTRPITVRSREKRFDRTAGQVYDAFDSEGELALGYETIDSLIVLRAVEGHNATTGMGYTRSKNGVARAVAPNYVADFLSDLDAVYDGTDEVDREMAQQRVLATDPDIFGDCSREAFRDAVTGIESLDELATEPVQLGDIGADTVIVAPGYIEGRADDYGPEVYCEALERVEAELAELDHPLDSLSEATHVFFAVDTVSTPGDEIHLDEYNHGIGHDTDGDPAVIEAGGTVSGVGDAPTASTDIDSDIHLEALLPESVFPRDAPEWEVLTRGTPYGGIPSDHDRSKAIVKTLAQLRPDEIDDDTEAVFVSARNDGDD